MPEWRDAMMAKRPLPPLGERGLAPQSSHDSQEPAVVVDTAPAAGDAAHFQADIAPWPQAGTDADAETGSPASATAATAAPPAAATTLAPAAEAPSARNDASTDARIDDATAPAALSPPWPASAADSIQFDLPLEEDAPRAVPDIRTEPGEMPSFVREAERAARWRQPHVRAALAVACLAAGLVLAGQWLLAQRDLVAAQSATLKPMLEATCAMLGCRVEAPRALEALRVESSGLARIERGELYRLSIALRNLRTHEVALPALELALTDTQGQLIARRVLNAAELGARVVAIGPASELTLQSTLQVSGPAAVAGYTIELFYP